MKKTTRKYFLKSLFTFYIPGFFLSLAAPTFAFCKKITFPDMPSGKNRIFEPGYLKLHRSGELKKRGRELWQRMKFCDLCPRECGANRLSGERGFCGANDKVEIYSYHQHFGEEAPLVGKGGSGAIFLSNCNLRCVFCINWEISQGGEGRPRTLEEMANMMLHLQDLGTPNINIVTPTHYAAHVVLALDIAASKGLHVPLVYNTSGTCRPLEAAMSW